MSKEKEIINEKVKDEVEKIKKDRKLEKALVRSIMSKNSVWKCYFCQQWMSDKVYNRAKIFAGVCFLKLDMHISIQLKKDTSAPIFLYLK